MPQPTSKARLVITALFTDHQTPAEVADRYGINRAWVYKLKARYEAEGEAALEPRSRRPKTSPNALPAEVVDSMPKALSGPTTNPETHERVRHDRVDKAGSVTLRHNSRLHHLGIGRTHAGTCVILLVQDLQIRVVNAATGELLRELVLDPTRDYQPTRAPKGPTREPPK